MDRFETTHSFVVERAQPEECAPPTALSQCPGAERRLYGEVRYLVRREGWDPLTIEAAFNPDGTRLFEEQERDERGWFPHPLTAGEEAFALDLLRLYPPPPGARLHPRFGLFPLPVFGG